MANYMNKAVVNTAIEDHSKLDLGHQQITTSDFMQLGIDYIREMVPGESISVNMETFARLNPMPVPTFMRCNLKHSAFFVPMRTIYRGFDDMVANSVHVSSNGVLSDTGILTRVPTLTNEDLFNLFIQASGSSLSDSASTEYMCYQVASASSQTPRSYDFCNQDTGAYFNFTSVGRLLYKSLLSLGYNWFWTATDKTEYSMLPILALLKVYGDYYYPQSYHNTREYRFIQTVCNYDSVATNISFSSNIGDFRKVLLLASHVQFDSDYFVSAWDNPVQPNDGNYSNMYIPDISTIGTHRGTASAPNSLDYVLQRGYVSNNNGPSDTGSSAVDRVGYAQMPVISPLIGASTTVTGTTGNLIPTPISEYLLTALKSLTDYMKRNQIAGSTYERFLARYGQSLPAEKLRRSVYLGTQLQPVQIGDVTSTSDTDNSVLGAYAGKGLSHGGASWDYSTDEFGYLIIMTSIVPNTGYYQGIDRQVLRITPTEFYLPEFDNLGVQEIRSDELYIPEKVFSTAGTSVYRSGVFGFTPRYADYKVSRDQLVGNFRCNSLFSSAPNDGVENAASSWHAYRIFDVDDFKASDNTTLAPFHSVDFMYGFNDASQFKRVFYNSDGNGPDNFTIINNFEIASYFPGKSLYDTYEFEDKGKRVTLDNGGVKVN